MMNQPIEKKSEKMKIRHEGGVVIQGVQNLLIRISRCNPVSRRTKLSVIFTKGRGISITPQIQILLIRPNIKSFD